MSQVQRPLSLTSPETQAVLAETLPLTALDSAFAQFLSESQSTDDPRHSLLAALVSHQYGRGHACLDLQLLTEFGVVALGWDTRLQDLLPAGLAAAASGLPWVQGPGSPLVLDGTRLYLRRNWAAEQAIRRSILARLAQPCAVPDTLKAALDSLFAAPSGGTASPDWQKVVCAVAAHGRFTLITGGPGTGKTTTVVRLLGLLQSQATRIGKPLRIALAAPTGKAAARLGESISVAIQQLPAHMQANIPTQAQTLHKLLQVRSSLRASPPPALALDLVVVDEASMIDLETMARLLAAVPISASLILLGDKDQLASVEAGAVMGQLCDGAERGGYTLDTVQWVQTHSGEDISAWSGNGPGGHWLGVGAELREGVSGVAGRGSSLAQHTVMLRLSRRFAADSVIGQWASAVNAGERQQVAELWSATPRWSPAQAASVTRLEPSHGFDAPLARLVRVGWHDWLADLVSIGSALSAEPLLGRLQSARSSQVDPIKSAQPGQFSDAQALALLAAFGKFQVLCALREGPWGVTALNRAIARALGFVPEGWYAGRPVMVTRNDYHLNLMNGDVGLCLPTAQGLRVAFAQGTALRWVLPSRLDAVETVFAMTVHKSQGSEFDHVALLLPDRIAPVLTRELLYTGITRAKKCLTLVVPQVGVLRQAAASRILRSGGLSMG
ncbi:MAG: exodeoxyribonuclease V subunit alpha [Rhodoferax sp.]|uniref:exodeoxyribonuclease V subunit alpha n=1 Tax=Rhodoferax sp. TaxID=50421 RepID=UPI0026155DDB|nr:exodeoxyribonuclease V subunit alpha [Rhodoferax sp.]MDD2881356.1 exodeoxyribonuclease V subunit alpha [Rhodoferax sp.]